MRQTFRQQNSSTAATRGRPLTGGRHLTVLMALGLLAFLAGCASNAPMPMPAHRPAAVIVPPAKPAPDSGAMCLAALPSLGVRFQPVKQAEPGKGGCTLDDGVRVTGFGSGLSRPAEMTCIMATRLADFDAEVLQPAAKRHFGQRIATVNHAGAFTCKPMTGAPRRISEHGHGRAIDVWGFALENGHRISVKEHWNNGGREQRFLREITQAACRYFANVLTPSTDSAHHDHLHFDIGRGSTCSA